MIEPRFDDAYDYEEGRAHVVSGDQVWYIDERGRQVFSCPDTWTLLGTYSEGMLAFRAAGKWGYCDSDGNVVVSPRFDQVYAYHEGLAAVNVGARVVHGQPRRVLGGLWGFVDKTGRFVVKPRFAGASRFSEELAAKRSQAKRADNRAPPK